MFYSRLAAPAALLFLVFLLVGCSTSSKTGQRPTTPAGGDKLFAVTSDAAAFFRHGPQAGRDPDKTLPRETIVKLIRPSFGYSKVELVTSGEQGYVATDEIKPTSSMLIASTTASHPDSLAPSSTPAVEQFNLNSDDPRLVPPPEELPNPDLPVSSPGQ